MKPPRFQFGLRALLIGIALVALGLWAWPKWLRYRAIRSLNAAVEGEWAVSSTQVKGASGADRNRLPDYERLKSVAEGVQRVEASEDAVAMLVAQLNAANHHTRTNAAIALRELGLAAKSAVPDLLELLDDDDVVAANAVHALEQLGDTDERTVSALSNVLLDPSRYALLRFSAAVALGKMGQFGPIIAVIEREQAAWATNVFGQIGARSKDALPAIAEMLKSVDPALRRTAVDALAAMAPQVKEAIPLIEGAKDDEDPSVRDAAVGGLRYINLVKQRSTLNK